MPNDKLSDHPLSDILSHDLSTYGPEIDALEGPNGKALADRKLQEILVKAETDSAQLERLRARLLEVRAQLRG